jgi:hypothetical protein
MLSPVKAAILAACAAILLAVPALSYADDAPSPAADACKAEYLKIGPDAFKAKYGANEPYQVCLREHGGTVTPPTPPPPAPSPEGDCKAEYVQLGADAFRAKYGETEPLQACIRAHGGTVTPPPTTEPVKPTTPPPPPADSGPEAACKAEYLKLGPDAFKTKYGADEPFGACVKAQAAGRDKPTQPASAPAAEMAKILCLAEAKALGRKAFVEKYGKEALGACVKAALPKARAILAACKESSGTDRDAFKACVAAALKSRR